MPRRFRELVASCSKSQFPAVSSSSAAEASSSMLSALCMLCEAWHRMQAQLHVAGRAPAFTLQPSQTMFGGACETASSKPHLSGKQTCCSSTC